MFNLRKIIINQQITLPLLTDKGVQLFIKKANETHRFVSGNKFWKLKYNIQEAKRQKKKVLITFGGAFSNHILATAVAGKKEGFKTIGIIRGEELGQNLNKTLKTNFTLKKSYENEMIFQFVSRENYRKKESEEFINKLKKQWGDFYLIPEGGTNDLAVKGCEEILINDDSKFNYICCPVGTGGTLAGLINSAKNNQKIIGFSSLKGEGIHKEISTYVHKDNWNLQMDYHFGGYAKYRPELIEFINKFKKNADIQLDPIYTGKMLFGIIDLIGKNRFPIDSKILAIHTGGLQAIEGFNSLLQKKKQLLIESI